MESVLSSLAYYLGFICFTGVDTSRIVKKRESIAESALLVMITLRDIVPLLVQFITMRVSVHLS